MTRPSESDIAQTEGEQGGEWTFIDRDQQLAFEEIAEFKVDVLVALYRRKEWDYETIAPDGSREERRFDG